MFKSMNRRNFLTTGAVAATLHPIVASRAGTVEMTGFEMPLESKLHERTFMQWPVSLETYDEKSLRMVQGSIALIANTIAKFEPVVMLAGKQHAAEAKDKLDAGVELWDIPTDDLWCRDSGPTFVVNPQGQLAVSEIRFNGWGNKQAHPNDGQIAKHVADRLGLPFFNHGLVGEQGGVEHDGAGTLLAHASSWVNPNRNKGSADEVGALLLKALGGRKIIWAPGIVGADITDYHIDALARFVAPGKVLIQLPKEIVADDPWSASAFETYEILKKQTDAEGRPLQIVVVPEPVAIRSRKKDFVASYVNYYVCNGGVVCSGFGDDVADSEATDILQKLYPDRQVVVIDTDPIGESGGGIHCATQQQPVV